MTYTRNVVDTDLRERVFDALICEDDTNFVKINDRQYGIILTDLNGVERYVRIGAIVAEERKDKTARELMASEQAEYSIKIAERARKIAEKAEKIAKDEAKRKEQEGA